ncbi:GDSL esterase/lipase [Thalictrum thalictroides]|uniref:GDSL esterase/lipase n=1 Tax=Thalictrum thalictroides TaxID=46969 RepID=A0A7J6VV78_THATH|nr:GDSL esterase/lipase [Thalictrum thalictroides]
MDYDFRNKGPPYDTHIPMYRPTATTTTSTSSSSPHISSFYPKVGQQQSRHHVVPPPSRSSSFHPNLPPPPPPSSVGMGIRVMIKPEYRINPPPQLSPHVGEIPRSTFQFDFDFERKVLAEAEKEIPNWSRLGLDNALLKTAEPTSSPRGPVRDPVVSKYIASGLSREAVPLAVANYGDNPSKVQEFVNGYNLLREMGFSSSKVAEALAIGNVYEISISGVKQYLPDVFAQIVGTVKELYNLGGRIFFILNLAPVGCYPAFLVELPHDCVELDKNGCMMLYNKAVADYNNMLKYALVVTQKALPNTTIVYVDVHSVYLELLRHPKDHGLMFGPKACCGYGGGDYNFNLRVLWEYQVNKWEKCDSRSL